MTNTIYSFAQILDPVTPETFFAEYHDKKPLHVPGTPEKFAGVMSWPVLNDLLNMTAVWSATSLQLVLDKEPIAPARYCRPAVDRNNARVMQPDAGLVTALLRQGASLVANDIDTLTPELAAVADALEAALGAKAQANLYCSWRERQAFDSHFDTHDVYALHVEGEKVWRIYETRVETPIAHPRFKTLGQAHHDQAKGPVAREVTLRPGDLLYLPRGQYHDALASSQGSVHIALGMTAVIGIDFLDALRELAIEDPLFRANVPAPAFATEERIGAHLKRLAARLGEIAERPEVAAQFRAVQKAHHYKRRGYGLPEAAMVQEYRVRVGDLKVAQVRGRWALTGTSGSAPIPPGAERFVAWIMDRDRFSGAEIEAAFPDQLAHERGKLLRELAAMKVIEPA
jgi:ribosomal protein L16 Arg81 hydroxylase